jgi:hypothetical protein
VAKKKKNPAAVSLGRSGGKAAAKAMSKKARKARATKAAYARWKKEKGEGYQAE